MRRGWSQRDLAMKTGLPNTTISGIERRKVFVWPNWRKRLAHAFGVTEAELFASEEQHVS
jgi:transcriptional regulator with XRE-family HTH domain